MKVTNTRKSKGFTIVELLFVLMIIAVLAILGIPIARGMIIGGKVEPTASDINKVVAKIRTNFTGQGATPYGSIDTSVFANTARTMATSLNVTGAGATADVTHELGATGATIVVAPSTITTANDSYTITLNTVDDAGCAIGAQMGKSAEVVTLNTITVKANATSNYNGAAAQTACTSGETNTFVFTFR
jgi:type IV pilus assembly protein PilA